MSKKNLIKIYFVFGLIILVPIYSNARQSYKVKQITTIKEYGKSVDWNAERNQIASARPGFDRYYDVFIMDPDGSNEVYITRNKPNCPQKHNGNPVWHPKGKYIVFTAQNEDAFGEDIDKAAIPGRGYNCNLWLAKSDGSRFWQLTFYPTSYFNGKAVIHPQFSSKGKKLFWAERVWNKADTSWGEWILKVADIKLGKKKPRLKNIRTYQPGERKSFYESHQFYPPGKQLLFSGNLLPGQPESGLDIYLLDMKNNTLTGLTTTFDDWDEHAHYSSQADRMVWMSSKGFDIKYTSLKNYEWGNSLITELWIMDPDGANKKRLTFFNKPGHSHYLGYDRVIVSDSAWSPDGKKLIVLVACMQDNGQNRSKLLMIELKKL